MNRRLRYLLLLVIAMACTHLKAQDLLKGNDLSQLRIDQVSEADIAKLKSQLTNSGITMEQAEQMALGKGMSAAEFAKLKQRLEGIGSIPKKINPEYTPSNPDSTKLEDRSKVFIDPKIFGSELFNSDALRTNNNSIPTPYNYILGVNDQLALSVYGVQQANENLTVSREGVVSIANVGQVKVLGLTIEEARERILQTMSNGAYRSLINGGSRLTISLSDVRGIHITVIGGNRPGNLTLSSLSTAFYALYMAGGPGPNGSYREIELIRNGKLERKIDLYRFLINGNQEDNVRLKDNDVLRIPAYKKRIELKGQIKRPGIFELLPGETFSDALAYASGFTDTAYKASVHVSQFTDKERQVKDLSADEYNTYQPLPGDTYDVDHLLPRYTNRVQITGAVFRPSYYELTKDMHVADLIRKADGLREDAFISRGQILRVREDLSMGVVSFNIANALNGVIADNVLLKREDQVTIYSLMDLRDSFKVSIQGEVRTPGQFSYVQGLSLKDLVIQAGGFTDAAQPQRIEIYRLLRQDSLTSADTRSAEVFNLINGADLSAGSANIMLLPFDLVIIRRSPGYQPLESVTVSGQVQYPGPYVIISRGERISNLIKRAGGLTPKANIEGAYLNRYIDDKERQLRQQKTAYILQGLRNQDSTDRTNSRVLGDVSREFDQIPLDLQLIINQPGSTEDLVLSAKDELYVPKFNSQVRISGSILLPTQIPYKPNYGVEDYIAAAGGLSSEAFKRKIYVLYANGKAATTHHFLFFKFYPKVQPGSEVVVPKRSERKTGSVAETIGLASAVASMAGVIIAILRL